MNILVSHPVWGAWIEMLKRLWPIGISESHPVWGAWIEICCDNSLRRSAGRRTPCGVRGLKLSWLRLVLAAIVVAPRVGCVD